MLGIRFVKVPPNTYLFEYRHGRIIREGAGLSFFYFGPNTSLVAIPTASTEVPFIFEERTSDFQSVTVQGQVAYRVAEPRRLASLMDFTLLPDGTEHASEDPQKLPQRVLQVVQVQARAHLNSLPLREALQAAEPLVTAVRRGLDQAAELANLGLEILGLSILAIRPTPDVARALEAATREQLLRAADDAVYARRNAAVEQERVIKENELDTEIATEIKKRQIRETQMDAERALQERERQIRTEDIEGKVALERQKQTLVQLEADNARTETDAQAYRIAQTIEAIRTADPRVVQVLATAGMPPAQLIAAAFQELAAKADRIGQLNVSPDLLRELIDNRTRTQEA